MAKKDKTEVKEVKPQKTEPPLYDWMDELEKKKAKSVK